jgi:hypothetical protein
LSLYVLLSIFPSCLFYQTSRIPSAVRCVTTEEAQIQQGALRYMSFDVTAWGHGPLLSTGCGPDIYYY